MSNPLVITCLIPYLALRSATSDAVSRLRPGRPTDASQALPRVRAEAVDLAQLLRGGGPVIIEGLAESLAPQHSADLPSLRRAAATATAPFEVKVFDAKAPYFLYVGDYGQTLVAEETMTLDRFLRAMFDEEAFAGRAVYRQFDQMALNGVAGSIIDALAEVLAGRARREPEKRASGIWIGSRGVLTPLHYDAWPGLLFQTHGSKRLLMFAPRDIPNLYFNPQYAVQSRWSRLPARSQEADPAQFPRYRRAVPFEGTLHSGDTLYVPPFWPHEIEALEPNISIPFRFTTRTVDYFNPRFLRPACEVFYNRYLKHRR
jgi:hypothetical protein